MNQTQKNPIQTAQNFGQSIWYDNIRRAMLNSGELEQLVNDGVMGVTSNPTIFEKAIAGSQDYDVALRMLAEQDLSSEAMYEQLAIEDIQQAADILHPIYELTKGRDGFVSLEVRPTLAHDTRNTIEEARRLFRALDRPNVMIKVPATPEGIPAIQTLISEGISVNVTLIFSMMQYEAVAAAYLAGLEQRLAKGESLNQVASVASFFISRIDTAVDAALDQGEKPNLKGKIGIANAKAAYASFKKLFSGPRWEVLARQGARVQRPLWASTGTKNPLYADTLYVDDLIGPETVNTVPPATLQAFRDHGTASNTLETGLEQALTDLAALEAVGIDLDTITSQLLSDGLKAFEKSFESLLQSVEEKRVALRQNRRVMHADLGVYQDQVDRATAELRRARILPRIWAHDHSVWREEPDEIVNRLGWLHSPEIMRDNLPPLYHFAEEVRQEGYTQALLLGMGGSSLAPEVFRKIFGVKDGYLDLAILDSTDPGAVQARTDHLDLQHTLFIVSTKSGGTVETFSFFKHFYNQVAIQVGRQEVGKHFIAITDPGSKLIKVAEEYGFRKIFLNDPNIGGRYSALSYFGLVPAALLGVDLDTLLERALTAACNCDGSNCPHEADNLGGQLGAILGEMANLGRDKLTLITSPALASFGDWAEQLIAESTGKDGKGILPVVGEALLSPEAYRDDRLFVYLPLAGDNTHDMAVEGLSKAGHPVARINLKDRYDLGAQFFLWEMATAVAGQRLGIHPFDQPNVESAKILARQMVAAYQSNGTLPETQPDFQFGDISVIFDIPGTFSTLSLTAAIREFLDAAGTGAYVSIQAYIQPTSDTDRLLGDLRRGIQNQTRLATTLGYGPRFLHSTGQLHKGDGGKGLFLQITSDAPRDLPIPDVAGSQASSITFGILKLAQALGDRQALLENGRRVLRVHLGKDAPSGLQTLLEALA
ncbi:MAG: bifunctional transaldolase/phosoglucose isomerase [Anaerolineales bacterium]|nr:bifunctional transaldolase/phosoglucose isomerase [Anaerolineales bacterium]